MLSFVAVRVRWCLLLSLFILAVSSAQQATAFGADDESTVQARAIKGKITDENDKPLAKARVTLFHHQPSKSGRWGHWKPAGEPIETDSTGTFQISVLTQEFYTLSVEREGYARTFQQFGIDELELSAIQVVMKRPGKALIQVKDQQGRPITGARVRQFTTRGPNGQCRFWPMALASLGFDFPASDEKGDLELSSLPTGDVIDGLVVDHLDYAPAKVDGLEVGKGGAAQVRLDPGVPLTFRISPEDAKKISGAVVDFRHRNFSDPSTHIRYEALFDSRGVAKLSSGSGNFNWLLLQHDDYYITPVYSANYLKKLFLRIEPGRNQELTFEVRRKVAVRGRVVDAATGKPLQGMDIRGDLKNRPLPGWDDLPPQDWSFAGWATSDADGFYSIDLAEGGARVSFEGLNLLPLEDHTESAVKPDGSSVVPDIRLRPLSPIIGHVKNSDGTPAERVVVRLRGIGFTGPQIVLTDASGRFELRLDYVPLDGETGERVRTTTVVAFDPYRPGEARAEASVDKPEEVVLQLEPHDPDWLFSDFSAELGDWQRGKSDPDLGTRHAEITLRGQLPPALDAVNWLNSEPLQWADLRGKFVILDFWFIGCGPCHEDFPALTMLHELYKDRGVVVIGVHNNSRDGDAVRRHVEKIGLPFPIAVDYADGRIIQSFTKHGFPDGYPTYALISREGKLLLDDTTIPHPTLRSYKIEIIRKYLLEAEKGK